MHEISVVDGFLEITENLADNIKFTANEPCVGLFYVQQHIQNAVPNLISLKNNVAEQSHETTLHTEDLEDSTTIVRSMKQCGFPIVDEMIREIKKSLSIMSTKQPKQGLIYRSSSDFLGNTSSWSPASWGRDTIYSRQDGEKTGGYLSSVLKSAKLRAGNFMWSQVESKEASQSKDKKVSFDLSPAFQNAVDGISSTIPQAEAEGLPLSSQIGNELLEESQLC